MNSSFMYMEGDEFPHGAHGVFPLAGTIKGCLCAAKT
jgi:hypothetical protein